MTIVTKVWILATILFMIANGYNNDIYNVFIVAGIMATIWASLTAIKHFITIIDRHNIED